MTKLSRKLQDELSDRHGPPKDWDAQVFDKVYAYVANQWFAGMIVEEMAWTGRGGNKHVAFRVKVGRSKIWMSKNSMLPQESRPRRPHTPGNLEE